MGHPAAGAENTAAWLTLPVFLFHQAPLEFCSHPFETPMAVLAFDPSQECHASMVRAQPTPGAAPVSLHPHRRLIPASGSSAFNRNIGKHECDGGLLHDAPYVNAANWRTQPNPPQTLTREPRPSQSGGPSQTSAKPETSWRVRGQSQGEPSIDPKGIRRTKSATSPAPLAPPNGRPLASDSPKPGGSTQSKPRAKARPQQPKGAKDAGVKSPARNRKGG
jgi:hypothetical protein